MRSSVGIRNLVVCIVLFASLLPAQENHSWTYNAANEIRVIPNVVYSTANGYDSKLDVYLHRDPKGTVPVVLFIHGGGWVAGSKEGAVTALLPWMERGLTVVNVEYRMARVSLAPAAVEDCRLALRWVFKNAKQYGFDTTRVIVTGSSAGGHLALMTGMLNAPDGFDTPTDWDYATVEPKVAAIINWFGITDVKDLLAGPNKQNYAVNWIGDQKDKDALAQRVSPLTYVRKGLPPIFSVQGDHDELVPYSHSVRLHEALTKAGVPNKLLTIPGGKHGGFTKEEMAKTYNAIFEFLKQQKVLE
ncbi:MAG TPA: alpha/beta hydrolase [Bacteroidota bacterium]|nr:alpha/beta hydrolase [Bacteroidota bacterium]